MNPEIPKIPLVPLDIVQYCAEEVGRQHDGPVAVHWMCEAWMVAVYAWLGWSGSASDLWKPKGVATIQRLGALVHPAKNANGFRRIRVRVGDTICPEPVLVPRLMENLVEAFDTLSPEDAYRALLEVHPFVDGNGRTAKIVFNWLKGTLLSPVMPPNWFNVANP